MFGYFPILIIFFNQLLLLCLSNNPHAEFVIYLCLKIKSHMIYNLPGIAVRLLISGIPPVKRAAFTKNACTGTSTAQGPPLNWTRADRQAALNTNPFSE